MQVIDLSIEDFLTYIADLEVQPQRLGIRAPKRAPLGRNEVRLVWENDNDWKIKKPLLVVSNSYLGEFLAFVSTYVKTFTPFTAFFRVVTDTTFEESLNFLDRQSVYEQRIPKELVGIVEAEAFIQSGGRADSISSLPMQSCLATLSSSVLTAISVGYDLNYIEELIKKWEYTKAILGDDKLALPAHKIASFWGTIYECLAFRQASTRRPRLPFRVTQFIDNFLRQRDLTIRDWELLCQDNFDLQKQGIGLVGTKEERIFALDKVADLLNSDQIAPEYQEIILGAAAAYLAGGSMSYLALMAHYRSHPGAALWFGFFVGLNKRSDVLDCGDSLGRHLTNHIFAPYVLFEKPTVDIDFNELNIAIKPSRHVRFRTMQTSSMVVELIPMVSGRFRLGKSNSIESTSSLVPIEKERWTEIKALTDQLSRLVGSAPEKGGNTSRLGTSSIPDRQIKPQEAEEQSDFFETKPKSSRRSASTKKLR